MIFHRCDRCGKELQESERNKPYIRQDTALEFSASLLVMDHLGRMVEDMCETCKLQIITSGTPSDTIDFASGHKPPLTVVPATEKLPQVTPPAKPLYEPSSKT